MKIKTILLLALTAFFYASCTSDVYNPDICFQENILPIFVSKCSMTGCHNSTDHKARLDLSNYEGIMKGVSPNHPMLSKVYTSVSGIFASMPIKQKLDLKDINYIKIWIKMGAQNTSNCHSTCDSTNFSYSGKIKPLMDNWCTGCHSAANPGGGYDLTTYTGVASSILNNRLIGSLKHSAGFSAMPKNTNKLTDCDINIVVKWVNSGYPNN